MRWKRAARGPRFLSRSSLEGGLVPPSAARLRRATMAVPPRKRRLGREARRALELISEQHGTTEAMILARGCTEQMLRNLTNAGLITIRHEVIARGVKRICLGKVKITDRGREALVSTPARRPSPKLP